MPQINANKQSPATAAAAKTVYDYLSRRVASSDGLPRLRNTSTFSEAARFDVIAAAVNTHAALKQLPRLYKRALEIVVNDAFEVPAELGSANAAEVRSWLVLAAEVLVEHAISSQGLVVLASLLTSDVDRTQLESAMSSILQSDYLQLFMNPSQYPMPVGCNAAIWRVGVIDVAFELGGFRTMQQPNIDISQLISDTGKSKWATLFDVVDKACGSATKDERSKAACALWAYALNNRVKHSKANTKQSVRRSSKRSTINTKRSSKRNSKRSKIDAKRSTKHNKDDTRSDINSNIIDNTAGPGSTSIDISAAAQLLISLLQRVPKTTPPLKRLVDKALHAFSEAIARCVVKFKGLSLLYDLERISQEILKDAVGAAEYFGRVLSEPDYISKYESDLPMTEIMNRYGTELEEILKEYLHMLHPGLNSDTRYALEGKLLTAIGTAQESHALSESDLEAGSLNEGKFELWVASELFGECRGKCLDKLSKLPGQPLVVEATLDRNRLSAAFLSAALKLGSYVRQLFCLLDSASGIDIAELGSQRMYIALVHSLTVEYMEACPLVLNVDGASYGTVLLRDYDPLTLDLRFDSDALADATDFSAKQVANAMRHLSMMQNVVAPAAQSLQLLTSKLTVGALSCVGINLASTATPPTLFDHNISAGFMELEWYRVRSFSDGLKSVHLPAKTKRVRFHQMQAVRLAKLVTAARNLHKLGSVICRDHCQYDGIAAEDVGCTALQHTFLADGRAAIIIAKVHNKHSIISHELNVLKHMQRCDNVVRLFSNTDKYTVDRFSYAMVLEQLDVGYYLNRQLQTVDTATECASQLLAGLIFFAKQGLIHMDIKPKSVGWSRAREQWSFFNFNLARYGRAGDGYTRSNIVVGSMGYIAPEVDYPKNFDYWHDCRADVYSLGVTLREMYGKAISTADQHHPVVQAVNWMIEENRDARHTASHIHNYLTKCASASNSNSTSNSASNSTSNGNSDSNSDSESVDECESDTTTVSDDDIGNLGTSRSHRRRRRATSNVSSTDSDATAVESLSNAASPSSLSVTVGSPSSLPVIVESPSPSLAESISHMSLVKPVASPLANQRATQVPAASPAC